MVIEEFNGKKTGFALVFFKDEQTAQKAMEEKNKQKIGNRYIELFTLQISDMLN